MLLEITIKNFAIIEEISLNFENGMTVLTGETGAGKSIIIGSVNVALGLAGFKALPGRMPPLPGGACFSVDNERQRKALERLDIPMEDDQIIISRRLINGRSVSKVNGETVPVSLVRQVSEILIDIHGQHEHQALLHHEESSGDSRCLCRGGASGAHKYGTESLPGVRFPGEKIKRDRSFRNGQSQRDGFSGLRGGRDRGSRPENGGG